MDKESSHQNFEWTRARLLREKGHETAYTPNRKLFLIKEAVSKHGEKAACELQREYDSKQYKRRDR